MGKMKRQTSNRASFKVGAMALVFLIIGYEASIFIHKAAVTAVEVSRDKPDTVYIVEEAIPRQEVARHFTEVQPGIRTGNAVAPVRRESLHRETVRQIREATRKVENFRFNPNTASEEELQRLGFSEKQAAAIVNYRLKGGRFRRKSDFAKSFVVADSVFRRLEPFIDIPKTDINLADSAAFDDLPGIGGYFASRLVEYRERLGGFSSPTQMMDIKNFDSLKFAGLSDLITCSRPRPYELWSLPAEELRKHPYIGSFQTARSIVFFREHNPRDRWTLDALESAGILSAENASRLGGCVIGDP